MRQWSRLHTGNAFRFECQTYKLISSLFNKESQLKMYIVSSSIGQLGTKGSLYRSFISSLRLWQESGEGNTIVASSIKRMEAF